MNNKNKLKILAIIPARSGSKSIKNKNIRKINNLPLLSYSIKTAKKSKLINKIIVTTDSPKIRKIALQFKAEAPFLRPKKISGDYSTDVEYIIHAIKELKKKHYSPDLIVILRPTLPFRDSTIVDNAIKHFIKTKADSLKSVTIASETPFKMWEITKKKYLIPLFGLKKLNLTSTPRQLLKKIYWQNGYVDITTPKTINKYKNELGKKITFYKINFKTIDIDYNHDLLNARNNKRIFLGEKIFPS
jgi:CMP-N,N'-diacetyllegionaminic acid synthase